MRLLRTSIVLICLFLSGCGCDENTAYNKMLALQRVSGRLAANANPGYGALAASMGTETGKISELIAKKEFNEACKEADKVAKSWQIDLEKEQEGMVTIEQLKADGGKGSGSCSLADAARKQMELHEALQKEVTAGKRSDEIFREFGEDTKPLAEMYSTNPSEACKLIDSLWTKYKVQS